MRSRVPPGRQVPAVLAVLACMMLLVVPAPARAQTPAPAPPVPEPPYRFSGLVFGDYYGFLDHHLPEWEGQHGFWLRRIYFTYDHTLSPKLALRLRLEMNSDGTLEDNLLAPYVKDASLSWTFTGRQQLMLGMHPSVTMEFSENVWGLRHVEKVPLDLYRVDSSRETGVSIAGPINDAGSLTYQLQYGNDSGNGSEEDRFKAVRVALRYERDPGWALEFVAGRYAREQDADRSLVQVFAGYRAGKARAGGQYSYQKRPGAAADPASDGSLQIYSGFGVYELKPKRLSLFARVDRVDDPCADCAGIDYLPIDVTAPFTLTIAGLEYYLHPSVRLSPNLEYVAYGTPPGLTTKPRSDVVARLTFFWAW